MKKRWAAVARGAVMDAALRGEPTRAAIEKTQGESASTPTLVTPHGRWKLAIVGL